MAGCKSGWDDERRDLAAVPCALPALNRRLEPPLPRRPSRPQPAAPTVGQATTVGGKTTSQCDAEYAANKAAIKSSGQTKRAFVAACRAGNELFRREPPPLPPQPSGAHRLTCSRTGSGPSPDNLQPSTSGNRRRRVHVRPTSSFSLPVAYGRLGQCAIGRLSFRRNAQLRAYEGRRVYVRGRRQGRRRQGGGERASSLTVGVLRHPRGVSIRPYGRSASPR